MQVSLFTIAGEPKGKFELPATIFGREGSKRVLHEVLVALSANQRRGTSKTKTRAEVSGGGHKPWKQKGTGNARSGSNRSPLWRKGGIIFGPRPRSYRIDMDQIKRQTALATALTLKAQNEEIAVLENMPAGDGKTGAAAKFLYKAAPEGRVLLIVDKKTDVLRQALRNLARITLVDTRELNPSILMRAQRLLFTQPALQALESRFPKG
jgi:large subunit ribosomal protein L4